MKMLQEKYNGKVPDNFDALLKLPEVGRKSANLIMGDVFGKSVIVTRSSRACAFVRTLDSLTGLCSKNPSGL